MHRLLFLLAALAVSCGSVKKSKSATNNDGATNNETTSATNNTTGGRATNNTVGGSNNTVGGTNGTNNTTNTNNRDWSTCYEDIDGDGFGGNEVMIDTTCADAGLLNDTTDCDDTDASIHPNAGPDRCDGIDRACDGLWEPMVPSVCPTIQGAIDLAATTGVSAIVEVAAGTYTENIVFKGANVYLRGAPLRSSIIDGSGADEAVVRFTDGEDSTAGMENFTITGGSGHNPDGNAHGGGIYVYDADPTLMNLVIRDNRAERGSGYGGGLSLERSDSLVDNVDIINNRASYYGGGLHVSQSNATLRHLRVINNESVYGGGAAIYFSDATFDASVFAGNSGSYGGGVMAQGDSPGFSHIHFIANTATEGAGFLCTSACTAAIENSNFSDNDASLGGAIRNEDGTPVVRYSNLFANGDAAVSGLNLSTAPGMLSTAPRLADTSGNIEAWDLHLQSGSPLRDAGDPSQMDYDGTVPDIGAFGGEFGDW